MKNNIIELGEGKHMRFYEVLDHEIISDIINNRAQYIDDDGW